jgi:hypothetical protein
MPSQVQIGRIADNERDRDKALTMLFLLAGRGARGIAGLAPSLRSGVARNVSGRRPRGGPEVH